MTREKDGMCRKRRPKVASLLYPRTCTINCHYRVGFPPLPLSFICGQLHLPPSSLSLTFDDNKLVLRIFRCIILYNKVFLIWNKTKTRSFDTLHKTNSIVIVGQLIKSLLSNVVYVRVRSENKKSVFIL